MRPLSINQILRCFGFAALCVGSLNSISRAGTLLYDDFDENPGQTFISPEWTFEDPTGTPYEYVASTGIADTGESILSVRSPFYRPSDPYYMPGGVYSNKTFDLPSEESNDYLTFSTRMRNIANNSSSYGGDIDLFITQKANTISVGDWFVLITRGHQVVRLGQVTDLSSHGIAGEAFNFSQPYHLDQPAGPPALWTTCSLKLNDNTLSLSVNGASVYTGALNMSQTSGLHVALLEEPTNAGQSFEFEGQFDYIRVDTTLPSPGDFNQDGVVNAADIPLAEMALTNPSGYEAMFNMTGSSAAADLESIADVNEDGVVNNADLQALMTGLRNGTLNPVPEPASLALLTLGSGLLIVPAWRNRRKNS